MSRVKKPEKTSKSRPTRSRQFRKLAFNEESNKLLLERSRTINLLPHLKKSNL